MDLCRCSGCGSPLSDGAAVDSPGLPLSSPRLLCERVKPERGEGLSKSGEAVIVGAAAAAAAARSSGLPVSLLFLFLVRLALALCRVHSRRGDQRRHHADEAGHFLFDFFDLPLLVAAPRPLRWCAVTVEEEESAEELGKEGELLFPPLSLSLLISLDSSSSCSSAASSHFPIVARRLSSMAASYSSSVSTGPHCCSQCSVPDSRR